MVATNSSDVPLLYGQNRFEIVLYGPQGQIRRETRNVPVGLDSIPPRKSFGQATAARWTGFALSHPDNSPLERDSMLELARAYDVDGLHFDYIRYPNGHARYCDGCRQRYGTAAFGWRGGRRTRAPGRTPPLSATGGASKSRGWCAP